MADEALRSLENLLESVPGWIHELESILATSMERRQEVFFENQPAGSPVQLSRTPSKSSSLLSKRSADIEHKSKDGTSPAQAKREDETLRSQLPHVTQSDILRLAQRKRKTASALSDLSGPPRFRSKSAVIIYYDGDVQKKFETVVRAIGANRNALRKGKIVAKVDKFSRISSGNSSEASSSEEQVSMRPSKLPYKTTRAMQGTHVVVSKDSTTEAFEKLDVLLEKAQALCEKAAHQVLRDGDCALEMHASKEHVVDMQKIAEDEMPTLQKRAEKTRERQKREHDRAKAERKDVDVEEDQPTPEDTSEKVENPFSSPGSLEVDLEADDSDEDDDVGFEVGALQLGKFGIRSTRAPTFGAV